MMNRDKKGRFIGGIGYFKGKRLSKETKDKIRLKNIGKKYTSEINKKKGLKGKKHPFWGKKFTNEHINNLREAHIGVKLSEHHRKRQGEGRLGDKNPNWNGGSTSENAKIRTSREYKNWRESVFKRDNWTCKMCGAKSKKGKPVTLNADHIKPFARYPDLRLNLENGRTLCVTCHKKTLTFMGNQYKKI